MSMQSLQVRDDIASLIGKRHSDVYQEIDAPCFSEGLTPRLVISSVDPEFEGRVMAELQLINSDGFAVFYSEPRDTLPAQWVANFEGKSFTLSLK